MNPTAQLRDKEPPIVIAVMGTTGVGKSTFISCATGLDAKVGNGLESCTSEVRSYPIPNTNISLIDTPGFDDTYKDDADILKQIADCLGDHFHDEYRVSGVLYIHAITEPRMKGSAMKNLLLFKKVIGEKNMANCVLVTTKWSQQSEEKSAAHERSLMTNKNFWKPLLDRGARVERFQDSTKSAHDIIRTIAHNAGFIPQITKEYTIQNRKLEDTSAGQEVNREIEEARKHHRKEMQELLSEHRKAVEGKDTEMAAMIEEERQKLQSELEDMKEQQRLLSKEREDERTLRQNKATVTKNRAGRWVARIAVGTVAVGFTVATGGLGAGLGALLYGRMEGKLQEERQRDKALLR